MCSYHLIGKWFNVYGLTTRIHWYSFVFFAFLIDTWILTLLIFSLLFSTIHLPMSSNIKCHLSPTTHSIMILIRGSIYRDARSTNQFPALSSTLRLLLSILMYGFHIILKYHDPFVILNHIHVIIGEFLMSIGIFVLECLSLLAASLV